MYHIHKKSKNQQRKDVVEERNERRDVYKNFRD